MLKFNAIALGSLLLAACSAPVRAPDSMAQGGTSSAATTASASPSTPADPRPAPLPGYLAAGSLDILALLPPAPQPGDVRYEADRRMFLLTRKLEGTPRWRMADDDALLGAADMLRHFSCAMDVKLEPAAVPQLLRLLQRSTRDAGAAMNVAKEHFRRQRPYHIDKGPLCRPVEDLGESFDYPSGHAMAGWTWGLTLAKLAPDRTILVLARARAIGESRVVCGVHNASAIEAARLAATAVWMALDAAPEWQRDAALARGELESARAAGARPETQACTTEAALVRESID